MRTRPEFKAVCLRCGGPLMEVDTAQVFDKPRGPRVPFYIHARHRDWATRPHTAEPLTLESAR